MKVLLFAVLILFATGPEQAHAANKKNKIREKNPPSILLVSVSSFDKTILGTYGAEDSPMPYLDSIAAKSTVFNHAFNSVSWRNLGPALYPKLTVKNFERRGLQAVGDPVSQWGYRIHKKLKTVSWKLPPWKIKTHRFESDEEIKKRLKEHFQKIPKGQWFSMVHFKRNHIPYIKQESMEDIPKEVRDYVLKTKNYRDRLPFLYSLLDEKIVRKMLGEPFTVYKNELGIREINKDVYGMVQSLDNLAKWKSSPNYKEDLTLLRKYYKISMKGIDQLLKYLLHDLVNIEKRKNLLTIVMGAHGESFMQHGRLLHGESVYDEEIRIPLIFHYPEVLKKQHVDFQVRQRSLAGIIFKTLMGKFPKNKLFKQIEALEMRDQDLLIVNCQGNSYGLRSANSYKIHYDEYTDSYKAFDLLNDPGEQVNIIFHVPKPDLNRLKGKLQEKILESSKNHDLIDETSYCPVTL